MLLEIFDNGPYEMHFKLNRKPFENMNMLKNGNMVAFRVILE